MANIKISELPAASAASATQEFETNDSGTSKKVTGSQLKSFVKSGLAVSDITDLTATAAELNFTDGVTSNIQTQLNSKAPSASPVFSGNMGLGVTPFAWGVDRVAFDLKNTAAYSAPSNYGGLANNAYYNGTGWVYKYSDFAQAYEQGGGFHAWYTAPSGTAGNPITWTKRLSINSSGAFGLNNDYGTSGQVLSSNGSGAAATWQDLSSAQVGAATAAIAIGGVGSYIWAACSGLISPGDTRAGSNLSPAGLFSSANWPQGAPAASGASASMADTGSAPYGGTWRCMGSSLNYTAYPARARLTLFLRIS